MAQFPQTPPGPPPYQGAPPTQAYPGQPAPVGSAHPSQPAPAGPVYAGQPAQPAPAGPAYGGQPASAGPAYAAQPAPAYANAPAPEEPQTPPVQVPALDDLKDELARSSQKSHFTNAWRNAAFAIIAVAAVAVLVSMLFVPVLRIFGNSMTPTLKEGSTVLAFKTTDLKQGDIVAFYYNNKVLVKRVIAGPGSWVDIDKEGRVTVNSVKLDEPYVAELALGECDIELPYQVPENRYFVMGDHRSTSIDSRSSTIGCVSPDQLVGRVTASIWPPDTFGLVS